VHIFHFTISVVQSAHEKLWVWHESWMKRIVSSVVRIRWTRLSEEWNAVVKTLACYGVEIPPERGKMVRFIGLDSLQCKLDGISWMQDPFIVYPVDAIVPWYQPWTCRWKEVETWFLSETWSHFILHFEWHT